MIPDGLPQYFRDRIRVLDNGCWEWTLAPDNHGYGRAWWDRKTQKAHTAVWELVNGPFPTGHVSDHSCHNPTECNLRDSCPHRRCVNPSHIEPVLSSFNTSHTRRAAYKGTSTHCVNGHERTAVNTYYQNGTTGCRVCRNKQQNAQYDANRDSAQAYQREWRRANSGTVNARRNAWRAANRDAYNAQEREWCAANRAAYNARKNTWRAANRETRCAQEREWYAANRDRVLAQQRQRRAARKAADQ